MILQLQKLSWRLCYCKWGRENTMETVGYILFFIIANVFAVNLGFADEKEKKKTVWVNILAFFIGILVGILYFGPMIFK